MDLRNLTDDTIREFESRLKSAGKLDWGKVMRGDVNKAIDTTTGLAGFNLEAPAKLVTPFLSPLNNRIPRNTSPGGTSVRFKRITSYAAGAPSIGVAEKAAAAAATIVVQDVIMPYKSFGVRDQVSWESTFAGRNFQDPKSLAIMLLLNRVKVEEDKLQLYGNSSNTTGTATSVALGQPAALTLDVSIAGGITGTLFVVCVPLTGVAYWGSTLAALATVGRGTARISASTGAIVSKMLKAYTNPVKGAVGYAWFVGTDNSVTSSANNKLEAITTLPEYTSTALLGTGQTITAANAVNALSADFSANAVEFDGVYSQMTAVSAGATYNTSAVNTTAATIGLGTALTYSGGGVLEIDTANKSVWDAANANPSLILMNAQEHRRISDKISASSATWITRVVSDQNAEGNITAGGRVNSYINRTVGGQQIVIVHPRVAPGNIIGLSEQLPYPQSNIANVLEMDMGADYTQFDYFPTTTTGPVADFEIRCYGVLKHYFPTACWIHSSVGDLAIT